MLDRRTLLLGGAAVGLFASMRWLQGSDVKAAGPFEIDKTDSEWRRLLTKAQYEVLRLHRTEVPGSSPLDHETRTGTFACAACDLEFGGNVIPAMLVHGAFMAALASTYGEVVNLKTFSNRLVAG